ncbi:MAG: CDP-diacylglycerol diphosphatase, partial [Hyphomicrobiales bacterium]|nr:CDP-diacylglycerol diphosphatase [Hyphomicrobiales bacterium]MBV8664028.1 CDP-diacylglycerol diphosphatase [Hyphomicrobiales bacterium]
MIKIGKRAVWLFGAIAIVAASPAFAGDSAPVDRNTLWNIVNLKCLRHLTKSEAPIPCDSVDVSAGWDRGLALLKDRIGRARLLAIPTRVVTGIEDPTILAAEWSHYFADAWAVRDNLNWRLQRKLSPDAAAITVDSRPRREQDQLSFAIDCLDEGVADTLAANAATIGDQWAQMKVALKGRTY